MHTAIAELEQAQIRSDIPEFRPGDTLKVHVRVVEGSRSRIQVFQGIVIRRQGGGARETFTVRKISYGVGVERTFPVHSPSIDKIEVVTRGRVRRAKLYYLRSLRGKAARIRERREPVSALGACSPPRWPERIRFSARPVPLDMPRADRAAPRAVDGNNRLSTITAVPRRAGSSRPLPARR